LGEKNWRACRTGDSIPGGTALITAETDRAEIELRDGSRIRLDYDTHLEMAKAAGEGPDVRPATLYLRSGRIWLLLTRAQAGMVVYTPTAKAEALGTIFSLSVEKGAQGSRERSRGLVAGAGLQTSIAVIRGKVQLSNQHGMITVSEGTCAQVATGQPATPPDAAQRLKAISLQVPWGRTGFIDWTPEQPSWADALMKLAGRRAWLGVEIEPTPVTDASGANGLPVTKVLAGSPAEKGDIKPGDRLVRMDELTIGSREDLARSELLFSPGQHVRLLIEHEGQSLQRAVTLAERGDLSLYAGSDALERANRQFATKAMAEAMRAYEEMVEKGEQKSAALNNLGVAYELTDRVENAVVAYREAVHLSPKVAQYRFNLAIALFGIGNLPRAADELEAALASDSAFADARFILGKIRALSGEYEAAVEQARSLQTSPASRAQGYCLMGEVAMLRGETKEAESWYLEATKMAPHYLDAQIFLARACFVQGRLDEAQQWAESALKLAPGSLQALNGLGLILFRRARLDQAAQVFIKAAALHPESGKVYNNLGLLYFKKGDLPASREAYGKAIELAPEAAWCHCGLAIVMERSGQFDEAKKEYATALRSDPAYEVAYQGLASLHQRLGEVQLAANVLDKARQYGL
jgi:tetratricopeptide (TPR) repeat protein